MTELIGLDYGKRRIGIATGNLSTHLAFPVGTHVEGRDGSILAYLEDLIRGRDVAVIVVGLPLTADGREGDMAAAARKFAGMLEERLGLELVLWDERYSSQEADRWLKSSSSAVPENRDAAAAQIILQSYLDHLKVRAEDPDPERGEP